MSDPVVVACVGAVSAVLVAVVTVFGAKINGRVRAVQHQVQNDHSTNMRVEQDERHDEQRRWWAAIWRKLERHDKQIDEMLRLMRANRDDIDALEQTINPKEKK